MAFPLLTAVAMSEFLSYCYSPADKVGVATLAAGVQRAGGSVRHPTSKMDDALEAVAAYVEVRNRADHESTRAWCS